MSVAEFDREEFLELAEDLVQRRGHAGAERSAISRSYYAAFHKASEYFSRQGERLTFTGEDHTLVWDWFVRSTVDQRSQWIGNVGFRLKQARRNADYDPSRIPNLSAEAQRWTMLTRRLLLELTRLP